MKPIFSLFVATSIISSVWNVITPTPQLGNSVQAAVNYFLKTSWHFHLTKQNQNWVDTHSFSLK